MGRVRAAVNRANITSFAQAGAYTRGVAQKSIKIVNRAKKYKYIYIDVYANRGHFKRKIKVSVSSGSSKPGKPPHSRAGDLKHAIMFEAERSGVVIGPTENRIGDVGRVHEFGGKRNRPNVYYTKTFGYSATTGKRGSVMREEKRRYRPTYPARPFMGPALERVIPRLPEHWRGSVRG